MKGVKPTRNIVRRIPTRITTVRLAVQRTNPENEAHENPVPVVVIADEQLPANIKNYTNKIVNVLLLNFTLIYFKVIDFETVD